MSASLFHGYIPLQARGVVTLPAEVRRRLRLDEPGAQLEVTEREDGVLELRASLPVPASERWFWDISWQRGEVSVNDYVHRGDVTTYASDEEFIASLGDA